MFNIVFVALSYLGLVCLLLLELPDDVALLLDGLRLGHLRWGHGRRVGGRRHTSVRIHPLHLEDDDVHECLIQDW